MSGAQRLLVILLIVQSLCSESWMVTYGEEHHSGTGQRHVVNNSSLVRRLDPYDPPGYVSDWKKDWSLPVGGSSVSGKQQRCIDIPDSMTLCRGTRYSRMSLPNLLDHDDITEASQQARSWVPLMNIGCHADTQMFLCSLFAPVCLDRSVWPCRSLCQSVKDGCEPLMLRYGFPWPEMLRCEKFPADNNLCIGLQSQKNTQEEESCGLCRQLNTFESIVDNYCRAEIALRLTLDRVAVSGSDLKFIASKKSKKKPFKKGNLTAEDLRKIAIYAENGARCKCNDLWNSTSLSLRSKGLSHLVMGDIRHGRLRLSYIQPIDDNSTVMNRAMPALRRGSKICKGGVEGLEAGNSDHGKNNGSDPKKQKKPQQKVDMGKLKKPDTGENSKSGGLDAKGKDTRTRGKRQHRTSQSKTKASDGKEITRQ